MSNAILAIGNFNLFKAQPMKDGKHLEFSVRKGEKQNADFSAYEKEKGLDVRGIRVAGDKAAGKKGFIRLSMSLMEGGQRTYFNAALFGAEKKAENQPDMTGSVDVGDGKKLRLAAWKKTGQTAGDYLSIAISEIKPKEAPAPEVPPVTASAPAAAKPGTTFDDMNDDCPF